MLLMVDEATEVCVVVHESRAQSFRFVLVGG